MPQGDPQEDAQIPQSSTWYFSSEAEERCPNTTKKKEQLMQGGKKKYPRGLDFLWVKTEVSKGLTLDVC